MKQIALLSLTDPFSLPQKGGKNDIRTRILALSRVQDLALDLYVICDPKDRRMPVDLKKYSIRNLYCYNIRSANPLFLFSGLPISVKRRFLDGMACELKKHSYDAIIYEGEYMAPYRLDHITDASCHIIRMHNIESQYRKELVASSASIVSELAQRQEVTLYKKLEKRLPDAFDYFLFISDDERKAMECSYPSMKEKFLHMPTVAENIRDSIVVNQSKTVLYYGDLEASNNWFAINWFAEKVFPLIRDNNPEAILRVCGQITDEKKKHLESLSSGIQAAGYVNDLEKEINNAALIISPIFHGAGVKVKLITALGCGQIVAATTKATEGTGLTNGIHLFTSDDPAETARFCLNVIQNRSEYLFLAENGLAYVKEYHSVESQACLLSSLF